MKLRSSHDAAPVVTDAQLTGYHYTPSRKGRGIDHWSNTISTLSADRSCGP